MSDYDLTILVARINNLYMRYGLSGPVRLREAAKGWLGIPIEDIIAAVELHFLHCRHLYAAGSGDAWFHLVQRAVDQLRDKQIRAENVRPRPPVKRGASHSPSHAQRPTITKLHRGAGYTEVLVDDDSMLDFSALNAPQPRIDRRPERVDWEGLGEDDDGEV